MIKKIIVLIGLQGSGKSYFAKNWVNEDSEHRIRFNRDDIRNMLGKYWIPSREKLIDDIYWSTLASATSRGYDIIIDNMNLNNKYVEEIKDFISSTNSWLYLSEADYRYEIEIKNFFDVPLETCIERDSKRQHPIGEEVIRKTYEKYKDVIENGKV